MAANDRLTFKVKFDCKCGNCCASKFLMEQSNKGMSLLCLECERRYKISLKTQEVK